VRLVYADFLEENQDADRAAFIRLECERARCGEADSRRQALEEHIVSLLRKHNLADPSSTDHQVGAGLRKHWPWADQQTWRGFPLPPKQMTIPVYSLQNELELRTEIVRATPEFYGAKALRVLASPLLGGESVTTLFKLPFIQQVVEWDLNGLVTNQEETTLDRLPAEPSDFDAFPAYLLSADMVVKPVIGIAGINVLAQHRESRKLTALDLRNNKLDNDAARALIKSPYLGNLRRLDLLEGNYFRGRVWQHVLERFGESVVG
jgi:hypothetical protein